MRAILSWMLFATLCLPAHAAEPALTDISVIPVRDGINTIKRFAADSRTAIIVRAWRDNGNAHGYDVYLVLLPTRADNGTNHWTGEVAFDNGKDALEDIVSASPFDGERVLGTVLFARAKLDGVPATVMVRADLGETTSGALADHAPVEISVYRLENPGIDVGTTPDVFHLISKIHPNGRFCNADMALATVLHIPLPATYAGGKAPSGCGD